MRCYISESFESFEMFYVVFGYMETDPEENDKTQGNGEGQPSRQTSGGVTVKHI